MRNINKIIIHITACDTCTIADIRAMHKARGFRDIGYHYIVDKSGVVHNGRPVDQLGAHTQGQNINSIGIAYISRGDDKKPNAPYGTYMTPQQKTSLEGLTAQLLERYNLTIKDVYGHNDFTKLKACPCFKVRQSQSFLDAVKNLLLQPA